MVAEVSECLYALEEPRVFFPREWSETASKARYRGWRELHDVGFIDCPFDPRDITVHRSLAYQITDSAFAEITHRLTDDPMCPGAYPVWVVDVVEC
jgi:hypothetical protein